MVQPSGARRELSLDEFLALPLSDRIRLLLERRVSFFQGPAEVPRADALAWIRNRPA